MMDKLRECPFCGGENVFLEDGWNDYNVFQVICKDCVMPYGEINSKQEAIDAWNTRADGWISVDERLPSIERDALVYSIDGYCYLAQYDTLYCPKEWLDSENEKLVGITHWQPLPEPPKGETDEHQ